MKTVRNFLLLAAVLPGFWLNGARSQQKYQMQPVPIQSRWAKNVSPASALKEYPRPQMVRTKWTNLNGLWNYSVSAKGVEKPATWDGQILVPYPLESALSGVQKTLKPDQNLWYQRTFTRPTTKNGDKVKLNFGAVDYEATVFVNGTQVGRHEGGYTEFSFDITSALEDGDKDG